MITHPTVLIGVTCRSPSDYPTLEDLVNHLAEKVLELGAAGSEKELDRNVPRQSYEDIATLSEDEALALLAQELSQE
ncbi:MAG: hypothetical protein HC921_19085 [Synechococcaceae cyanobacterium SM2_3_1]|nr:hypothetical protein [Synechococcaceae cyanobacterium SM2_3_1]